MVACMPRPQTARPRRSPRGGRLGSRQALSSKATRRTVPSACLTRTITCGGGGGVGAAAAGLFLGFLALTSMRSSAIFRRMRVRSSASASARDCRAFGALRRSASWIAFAMRRSFWRSEGALSVSFTTSRTSQSTCFPCLSAPRRVAKPRDFHSSNERCRRRATTMTTTMALFYATARDLSSGGLAFWPAGPACCWSWTASHIQAAVSRSSRGLKNSLVHGCRLRRLATSVVRH